MRLFAVFVTVSLTIVGLLTTVGAVSAAVVPGSIVVKEGDPVGAETVTTLGSPFTNGLGQVGFTGNTAVSDNFVWLGSGPIWFNSDGMGLTGAESTMGIGDAGQFIYSPSDNGNDAVWTHDGALLVDGQAAPDFPGMFNTFNSRPTMLPDGTAYWVAGFAATIGGTTAGRVLYRSSDTATPVITKVVASGDMVGGFVVDSPSGVDFDYHVSDDGNHLVQVLLADTGSTADDDLLVVDLAVIARESLPATGGMGGEAWDNFDNVAINNAGNYLFSGDTAGATATDEFIAYNGSIAIREGDTVGGVVLGTAVQALSIDNKGNAVSIWSITGGEALFFGPAANLASSILVLQVGDEIDTDGDGLGDFTVTDFNASGVIGPGLSLAEDGRIHLEVDLDDGGGEIEAIITLSMAFFTDGFESGDTLEWSVREP